jgi:hypothetical protein
MPIEKSKGQTPTEQYLSHLCERTFLGPWSYANPFKADGKELCDLIAVFENNVFLFFDRESRKFDAGGDTGVLWKRWKKEAITKQIRTAAGAKRYILQNRNRIFLDTQGRIPFPLKLPDSKLQVHKVIVAHGAKEACEAMSADNVYGSLGISYGDAPQETSHPFILSLERSDPVHVLDSHNLDLILGELDTIYDFQAYLTAKEMAIHRYNRLTYCGEEDLLAHYFLNFDPESKSYRIGAKEYGFDWLMIGEGEWHDFVARGPYKRRKDHNRISYQWDRLIQKTGNNALKGVLGGNSDVFRGKSAIHEMAKEPRLSRRTLCEMMAESIRNFPDNASGMVRNLAFMPSFYPGVGYVFLQFYHDNPGDYETEYRQLRMRLLEWCCGAAKLKWPHLNKVIGIAIEPPKYARTTSEDFLLLDCANWSEEDAAYYETPAAELALFRTPALKQRRKHATDFPSAQKPWNVPKIGRNQLCPCGSGKKYKRCHGVAA